MNQTQTSTIIVGIIMALALLAGVIVTVATISQQADARPFTRGDCIKSNVEGGFTHRQAAGLCRG